MRKEFRIVATKFEHHNIDGKEYTIDRTPIRLLTSYNSYRNIYKTLEEAQNALDNCIEDIQKYEFEHNNEAEHNKYGVIIHYLNIRIESRWISDWEI